jgi:hypothetical protein
MPPSSLRSINEHLMASDDEHLRACVRTAAEVIRNRRLRGEPVPEWMRRHQSRCESLLAMSRSRHQFDCGAGQLKESDLIDAKEVASMAHCSIRQAQRLAERMPNDLGVMRIGGRLLFRRDAVAEYVEGRGHG